jgi:uncharacterized protein (DUF3084 family)
MNPVQQKAHTRRTDELEQMVTDLGTVVFAKVNSVGQHADTIVNEERTHRLKLAEEQRAYVDEEDNKLYKYIQATESHLARFTHRTFWQRFKWLLFGEAV